MRTEKREAYCFGCERVGVTILLIFRAAVVMLQVNRKILRLCGVLGLQTRDPK